MLSTASPISKALHSVSLWVKFTTENLTIYIVNKFTISVRRTDLFLRMIAREASDEPTRLVHRPYDYSLRYVPSSYRSDCARGLVG